MASTESQVMERVGQLMMGDVRYEIVGVLPSGRGGDVVLAEDLHAGGARRVIRFVRASTQGNADRLQQTILHHRALKHPHIMEFDRVFRVPAGVSIGIAMEFGDGGNLQEYMDSSETDPNEHWCRWVFQQLVLAVDFCHRKGMAPRDIRLGSIFLINRPELPLPTVKLCDFGYSQCDSNSAPRSLVDTIAAMAPEAIEAMAMQENDPERSFYEAKKSDVWSCGVVLYELIVGHHPFVAGAAGNLSDVERRAAAEEKIRSLDYTIPDNVLGACRDLISKCLTNATNRLSLEGVMRHEWVITNLPGKEQVLGLTDQIMSDDAEEMVKAESKQPRTEIVEIIRSCITEQNAPGQGHA